MKFLFVVFFLFSFQFGYSLQYDTLYINRGTFTAVNGTQFPYLSFNKTSIFNQQNENIRLDVNETLIITVINNDTINHGFTLKDISQYSLFPQDTISDTVLFSQRSVIPFYDHFQFPNFKNSGLSGMIYVTASSFDFAYVWNLKDHQSNLQLDLVTGNLVNWTNYMPDYFTINEKSYSDIQSDPLIRVNQNIGDTIYIYVVNSGQSMHSLHFHGFHQTAIYENAKKIELGWEKDTWGFFSMDAVVLLLVPDKIGQYSVHDHNLVALSAGSTHPNGMLTIMQINP